jgi:hypothetical protein
MILQLDNGNEFNTAARTRKQVDEFCGKLVLLTDLELSEIITEVRQLWTPYHLVFVQLPRVGISALPLNASVLTQLATEAQLNRVCNYFGKVNVLDNETAVVEAIDDAEENKTADCDEIQANTNNSNNHEYVGAVVNYNVNGSGAADDNLDILLWSYFRQWMLKRTVHK